MGNIMERGLVGGEDQVGEWKIYNMQLKRGGDLTWKQFFSENYSPF